MAQFIAQLDSLIASLIVWYLTITITIPIIIFWLDILNKLREYWISFNNIFKNKEMWVKKMYNLLFLSYLLIISLYVVSLYYYIMKIVILLILVFFLYIFFLKIIKIFKYLESDYIYLISEPNIKIINESINKQLNNKGIQVKESYPLITKEEIFEKLRYNSESNDQFAKILNTIEYLNQEKKEREIILMVTNIIQGFYQIEKKSEIRNLIKINLISIILQLNISIFVKKVILQKYKEDIKNIIKEKKVDAELLYWIIISERLLFLEYIKYFDYDKDKNEITMLLKKYFNKNWFKEYKYLKYETNLLINIYINNILEWKTSSDAANVWANLENLFYLITKVIIDNNFREIDFLWDLSEKTVFEKKLPEVLNHVFKIHTSYGYYFYNSIKELLININNRKDNFYIFIILRLLIIKTDDEYKYNLKNLIKENIDESILKNDFYFTDDLPKELKKKLWEEYFIKYYRSLFFNDK